MLQCGHGERGVATTGHDTEFHNVTATSGGARTLYTAALYNCTLASASLASVLSTNHRRASIYLLHSDWSPRRRLEEEEEL